MTAKLNVVTIVMEAPRRTSLPDRIREVGRSLEVQVSIEQHKRWLTQTLRVMAVGEEEAIEVFRGWLYDIAAVSSLYGRI